MSKITLTKRPAFDAAQKARGEYIYATQMGQKLPTSKLAKLIAASGTTVSEADVLAVLHNIGEVVANEVMHGMAVEIPGLGSIHLHANGVMDKDGNDISEKGRRFRMKMTFKKSLRNMVLSPDNLAVALVDFKAQTPVLTRFDDAVSGMVNTQLTPGGMAGIRGKNLRLHLLMADEGVWFIPQGEGDIVRATIFLDNKPSRLTLGIPAELQRGMTYRVEVRTRINRSKKLAVGTLTELLAVAE